MTTPIEAPPFFSSHLQYSNIDSAFGDTFYNSTFEFKSCLERLVHDISNKENAKENVTEEEDITTKIVRKFNVLRKYFEDNANLLYNRQEGVYKDVKDIIENMTDEEEAAIKSEIKENIDFDSELFKEITSKVTSIIEDNNKKQDECEHGIRTHNVTINNIDTVLKNFQNIVLTQKNTNTLTALDALDTSVNMMLADIKNEKEALMKNLVRSVYFAKFVRELVTDTSLKTLTIYACPVCMENQVDSYNIKCGHTGCNKCLDKQTNCPVCRASKDPNGIKKLYFNGQPLYETKKYGQGIPVTMRGMLDNN